jgi:hypothetical protein
MACYKLDLSDKIIWFIISGNPSALRAFLAHVGEASNLESYLIHLISRRILKTAGGILTLNHQCHRKPMRQI